MDGWDVERMGGMLRGWFGGEKNGELAWRIKGKGAFSENAKKHKKKKKKEKKLNDRLSFCPLISPSGRKGRDKRSPFS